MESPEKKFLEAIHGKLPPLPICTKCGEPIIGEKPFYFNDKPYHPGCMPYGEE